MKKFTFKGIIAFFLLFAFSQNESFSQTATITPANSVILAGSSQNFTVVTTGLGGNNDNRTFAYTITGPGATIPATPTSIICTNGCNSQSHSFQFPTAGTYTVAVTVTQTQNGSAVASTSTSITVAGIPSSPNLWATSSNGNQISNFTVTNGLYVNGPTNIIDPFPSTTETTAALGRSDKPTAANGYFYWLPNNYSGNAGLVQVYASDATGGSRTLIGSLDVNGASGTDLGFVRLGMDANGVGWILAADNSTVYLAKFISNLANPVPITMEDASVALTGGTALTFFNGDICFSATGTMYALANNGATTQIFIGNPNGSSTSLTKKWDLVSPGGGVFNVNVNGVAFDLFGSLYVSTADGLYYINAAKVNGPAGTVECALVRAQLGLQDLASNVFPSTILLPVKLISFTGTLNGSTTNLNWVTESIQNFSHFEVERSADGVNFTSIVSKNATGDLSSRATYTHGDNMSSFGANYVFYYRLKMVDLDGKFSYSNVILVRKDGKAISDIKVIPNPLIRGSIATISFEASERATVNLNVLDMSGRSVLRQQNNVDAGTNSVPLNNFATLQPGTYILQMNDGVNVQTTKFIIAK
ncbi:MAG: T9SS type A sorting domain-containing protein [Chitinophagaceae bacterium]|nr:T9SS type A sorting domain-containing protein [Chitinophagaceae bacterium]